MVLGVFKKYLAVSAFLVCTVGLHGQVSVIMKSENGIYTVPCNVNGLKLRFVFDTGASDVSISLTEAIFMLKNGYLKADEVQGTTYAQLANGEITENTKILIREIEFAGVKIYNVSASVVHELMAPLLLGQSALAKLGRFQFDPNTGRLVLLDVKPTAKDVSNTKDVFSPYQTKITKRPVRLREKPIPSSPVIATIPAGATVIVNSLYEDENYTYYKVEYHYKSGYVYYLDLE